MKSSIEMQSEAQLPVSTSTHDKSGLKRSSCFPLSFPSVPASCFSPWSLPRLHPISMLHGEGKHSLPKVLLLGKGDLSQYCETALRTAEVAACCWKELFGTNLSFFPRMCSFFCRFVSSCSVSLVRLQLGLFGFHLPVRHGLKTVFVKHI